MEKGTVTFRMTKRRKPPDFVAYLFGPMENRKDHGAKLRRFIYDYARKVQTDVVISFSDPVALEYLKTRETASVTKKRVQEALASGDIEAVQSRMWPIKMTDLEIVRFMAELDGKEGRPKGILIGCFPRSPEKEKVADMVDTFIERHEGELLDLWKAKHPLYEDVDDDGEVEESVSQEEEVAFLSFMRDAIAEKLKEYLFDRLGEFTTTGGSSLEIGAAHELLVPTLLVSDNDLVPENSRVTKAQFMARLSSKWILSNVLDIGEIFMSVEELFKFLVVNKESLKSGEYTAAKVKQMKEWIRRVQERKPIIKI